MAQTPEAKVKSKVTAILNAEGAYYFSPATHGYGKSGVPDIVVCYYGRFIGIECKAGDNKTTVLQDRELRAIRESGGISIVVNEANIDSVKRVLERLRG